MLVVGDGVVQWVSNQIGEYGFRDAVGIGWIRDGNIVMGAVFEGYGGDTIHMHIASLPKERFTASFVAAIADYPFNQIGVNRVVAFIPKDKAKAIAFAEHIGGVRNEELERSLQNDSHMVYEWTKRNAERWQTAYYSRKLFKYKEGGR